MSKKTRMITRAWTDPAYRATLSASELAALPPNPAGEAGAENVLEQVMGGITFGGGCGSLGCFTACATDTCTQSCLCTLYTCCQCTIQTESEASATQVQSCG